MYRALTGIAPDGHVKVSGDNTIVPSMSSAFYSDDLLVYADRAERNDGALQAVIARSPDAQFSTIGPSEVGDLGLDLGRGFGRFSGSKLKPELEGPPTLIPNLRSMQATYKVNSSRNEWETITIFLSW